MWAMRHGDQLDATLAKHFAWSFSLPGVTADPAERLRAAEEEGVERADVTPPFLEEHETETRALERSRRACRPLAVAVAEAWTLADEEASARAAKRLLTKADRLGVVLVGMDAY